MRVALDFDGTLCDSMGPLEDLASTVVREAFPHVPGHLVRSTYRRTAGMPFDQQAQWLPVPSSARRAAAEAFAERKVAVTLACAPFPDVDEALRTWRSAGVEPVVVSSTTTDLLRLWLRRYDLADLVEQVYGLSYGTKLEQLQRCRPHAFVGDTKWDGVKAAEAGVTFLGVQRDGRLLSESESVGSSLVEIARSYAAGVSAGHAVADWLEEIVDDTRFGQ